VRLGSHFHAIPQEMQVDLAVKQTVHDAWEAIRKLRVGANRVKEANTEQRKREFGEITFKPGESVRISRFASTPS
jgi:hypothetical protein